MTGHALYGGDFIGHKNALCAILPCANGECVVYLRSSCKGLRCTGSGERLVDRRTIYTVSPSSIT